MQQGNSNKTSKEFLQMDMANLNNQQQGIILKSQQDQQRILSDQAAQNAARQFNSASETQTNQFMANLEAQMNQYNTAALILKSKTSKEFTSQMHN